MTYIFAILFILYRLLKQSIWSIHGVKKQTKTIVLLIIENLMRPTLWPLQMPIIQTLFPAHQPVWLGSWDLMGNFVWWFYLPSKLFNLYQNVIEKNLTASLYTPWTEWFLVSWKKPKKLIIHKVPLWCLVFRKISH